MSLLESTESTKCFPFLVDNIPNWLEGVVDVEKKIKVRRDEATRVTVPVSPRKRTGSNESIRINDDDDGPTRHPPHGPSPTAYSPLENTSAPAVAPITPSTNPLPFDRSIAPLFSNRKRKPASLISNAPSIPTKYRTRSMIIVYYDSEVQKGFEQLVRNIGTGRNMLRKGKMQARMDAFTGGMDNMMSALGRIGGMSGVAGADADTARALNAAARKIEATGHYDALDKRLDQAQSLAEKGAHQFLREGECPTEVSGIRVELEAALEWCRDAVAAMTVVSQNAAARVSVEGVRVEAERGQSEREGKSLNKIQAELPGTTPGTAQVPVTAIATIEVDSDVDEEFEIKLPPIRRLART
ncbi:hypothetical protein P152DRAFT_19197 [Eremomyces bilateralis CBS 781.70]|uniref:Uncharacterized protein n=1 Tax=Eremomyces bilateralis CBS 781.70 TaxID=1392243 RepID=A0A6G1GHL2_9PEZI|nr:uncharacterized protein P152DRAFT_19197 [Eremomyces bilateralis CBS 781.70]KAF1817436.1 hypothetical protein P152DRAFT_19197 [Eremomyces bilateralis CBS 781.70]